MQKGPNSTHLLHGAVFDSYQSIKTVWWNCHDDYHHETISVNKSKIEAKPHLWKKYFLSRGTFILSVNTARNWYLRKLDSVRENLYGVMILKCNVELLLGVSTLLFMSFKSLTFETVLTKPCSRLLDSVFLIFCSSFSIPHSPFLIPHS